MSETVRRGAVVIGWGRFVGRRARWVLVTMFALVVAAAVYGVGVFGALQNGGFDAPGSASQQVAQSIDRQFPQTRADVVVLYHSSDRTVADPAFRDAVQQRIARLDKQHVAAATTWWASQEPSLVSPDRHSTRVILRLTGTDEGARLDDFSAIKDDLQVPGVQTQVGGTYAVFTDVNSQVGADIGRAESIAMPIVFVLSLLIFGSVAAALMPTLIGGIAVLGAFAMLRVLTGLTDVSIFAINVVTLLGMGLAIDYALFVVSRFREELHADSDPRIAITRTMATAGRTVLFSGTLVAVSLSSLLLFDQMFLRSMGLGGMAAVLVAMLASLTVLPAVLVLLGHRIEWGSMPWRASGRHQRIDEKARAWGRVAAAVMRRPVLVLVGVAAGLLLLASPFVGVKWGGVDDRVLPSNAASRVANAQIAKTFDAPPAGADVILRDANAASTSRYAARARSIAGVTSVETVAVQGRDTLLRVSWSGAPESAHSQQLVRQLRQLPPQGARQALVGGSTAATVDLIDSIGARLPVMGVVVAAAMLVLLFLAFGSILLPIKAIVMNAVSITASFGVVTWVFQDGHLADVLGFTPSGYLDVSQPILMLAILFGLSMDYEVFLLSRVREEWDRTGNNAVAVVRGVAATGGIITSAALLLAVVIGGFATSGIVFIKMIGVGMLVAVLLDATVVRGLLVPATMRLLGQANWWAPAPLQRWWRRHGHHEGPTDPRPRGIEVATGVTTPQPRALNQSVR